MNFREHEQRYAHLALCDELDCWSIYKATWQQLMPILTSQPALPDFA